MAEYEIQVKRPVGRPKTRPNTPEVERDRARSRKWAEENTDFTRNVLIRLMDERGGACEATGTPYSFDKDGKCNLRWHHLHPSKKSFEVATTSGVGHATYEVRKPEADKCVLITDPVHAEIHRKLDEEMAAHDNATSWSSGWVRNHFRDHLCASITRRVIIKHQILKAMENY